MYFCRICYKEIAGKEYICHCMHCSMPFHDACIENYVNKHHACPQCKKRADMASMTRGEPPPRRARAEETSQRRISVAETRRMPHVRPTRRIDLAERAGRRRINFTPIIVGIVLVVVLAGGGYLAITRLPSLISSVEQQKPLPTLFPANTNGPQNNQETSPPPQTAKPGGGSWFSWFSSYLKEFQAGKSFQYAQEIYYSTRTVKTDIKWRMVNIVNVGNEKAILIELAMVAPIPELSKNLESTGRKWLNADTGNCIKVQYSTGGKTKEGDCTKSLFGAGVDFDTVPSWEGKAEIQGQVEVTVPAGIFNATEAQIETTVDEKPATIKFFFVEGKPPVKIEVYKEGKLYMLYVLLSST